VGWWVVLPPPSLHPRGTLLTLTLTLPPIAGITDVNPHCSLLFPKRELTTLTLAPRPKAGINNINPLYSYQSGVTDINPQLGNPSYPGGIPGRYTLYIHTRETYLGGTPLYIHTREATLKGKPLYIHTRKATLRG